ncbi:hypothetical protein AB0F72_09935 [Actinoplanes sp. NPDC023936]|uniref:hypothetical protein n=1 Tax=Actinoplanes sp. NPDC023936 TaxID=3154910 RepID=UPI0033D37513
MDEQSQVARLVVDELHRLSTRPWVFVTGRLEGGVLRIGDRLAVTYRDQPPAEAVIRTIEIHTRPGTTTIAVDAELADHLGKGAVLTHVPG